jgi:hypothetical protein
MTRDSLIEVSRDGASLTVEVPLAFRKRGGRKQVISPAGAPDWVPGPPQVQPTLIKAIARAHRWRVLLKDGTYASAAELSAAERINPSYVARVLRLTLLAPEIVEEILGGQRLEVTLEQLMKPFPVSWSEQNDAFRPHTLLEVVRGEWRAQYRLKNPFVQKIHYLGFFGARLHGHTSSDVLPGSLALRS